MRRKLTWISVSILGGCLLSSCSSPSTSTDSTTTTDTSTTNPPTTTDTSTTTTTNPSTSAGASTTTSDALKTPKDSIAYQLELIKAGDVDKLKTCLTPRVRDSVTQDIVDKAKTEAGKYTIDDLYASAEMGEADGKKTAKVKMKGGRTLTTLIQTDGKWLADTIWFK